MSPAVRSLGLTTAPKRVMSKYATTPPGIKAKNLDALRAIERAAATPEPRRSRCCGRCKTPYNCGNAGCTCHSLDN